MGMASFAVAEMGADERDYDNWLTTLTQASCAWISCRRW